MEIRRSPIYRNLYGKKRWPGSRGGQLPRAPPSPSHSSHSSHSSHPTFPSLNANTKVHTTSCEKMSIATKRLIRSNPPYKLTVPALFPRQIATGMKLSSHSNAHLPLADPLDIGNTSEIKDHKKHGDNKDVGGVGEVRGDVRQIGRAGRDVGGVGGDGDIHESGKGKFGGEQKQGEKRSRFSSTLVLVLAGLVGWQAAALRN